MAAATRKGNSILFTALTDTHALQTIEINGISFQGTGLTAGQRVLLQDDDGDTIADYQTEAAIDNADLYGGRKPKFYNGLKLASGTVAGTWVLTVLTN